MDRRQQRWDAERRYRSYRGRLGRTYQNSTLYTVWPWRPSGTAKSPTDLSRAEQVERAKHVGLGSPPADFVQRVREIFKGQPAKTEQDKMNLRLRLSVDDVTYAVEGSPSTATILDFQLQDFCYYRSEAHNSDDEDYKRAKATNLIINDVVEP